MWSWSPVYINVHIYVLVICMQYSNLCFRASYINNRINHTCHLFHEVNHIYWLWATYSEKVFLFWGEHGQPKTKGICLVTVIQCVVLCVVSNITHSCYPVTIANQYFYYGSTWLSLQSLHNQQIILYCLIVPRRSLGQTFHLLVQ